jgi:hypothetical protein
MAIQVGVSKEADTLNSGNRLLISFISVRERIYHSAGALRFSNTFAALMTSELQQLVRV